jgi:hypothetical protein
LPFLFPPSAPHSSSSIIWSWYNRPVSGRRTKWTQSHPTPPHPTPRKELHLPFRFTEVCRPPLRTLKTHRNNIFCSWME